MRKVARVRMAALLGLLLTWLLWTAPADAVGTVGGASILRIRDDTAISVDEAGRTTVQRTIEFDPAADAFVDNANVRRALVDELRKTWSADHVSCQSPSTATLVCSIEASLPMEEGRGIHELTFPADALLASFCDAFAGYPYALRIERRIRVDTPGLVLRLPKPVSCPMPLSSTYERSSRLCGSRSLEVLEDVSLAPGDLLTMPAFEEDHLEIGFASEYQPRTMNWTLLVLWGVSLVIALCQAFPVRPERIIQRWSPVRVRAVKWIGGVSVILLGVVTLGLGLFILWTGPLALSLFSSIPISSLLPPEVLQALESHTGPAVVSAAVGALIAAIGIATLLRRETGRLAILFLAHFVLAFLVVAIPSLLLTPVIWGGLPFIAFATAEGLLAWLVFLIFAFRQRTVRGYYRGWPLEEMI